MHCGLPLCDTRSCHGRSALTAWTIHAPRACQFNWCNLSIYPVDTHTHKLHSFTDSDKACWLSCRHVVVQSMHSMFASGCVISMLGPAAHTSCCGDQRQISISPYLDGMDSKQPNNYTGAPEYVSSMPPCVDERCRKRNWLSKTNKGEPCKRALDGLSLSFGGFKTNQLSLPLAVASTIQRLDCVPATLLRSRAVGCTG